MKTISFLIPKQLLQMLLENTPLSAACLHVVDLSVPVTILLSDETNS